MIPLPFRIWIPAVLHVPLAMRHGDHQIQVGRHGARSSDPAPVPVLAVQPDRQPEVRAICAQPVRLPTGIVSWTLST